MANSKEKQRNRRDSEIQAIEVQRQREMLSQKKGLLTRQEINDRGIVLTDRQKELYDSIRHHSLTICQGPAGTSKTFTTCYTALCMLADGKIDQIILTKPIQESGENLGFLPGTKEEKIDPYMKSYFSNFEKIIGYGTLEWMKANGQIVVEPLAYMRGTTYDRSLMILDEAQNCTMTQLMLWITRLGDGSKAVMMGDVSQYDIKKRDSKFLEFIDLMEGANQICNFQFSAEDIVRNKFLIEVVNRYEKWKSKLDENK